MSRTNRLFVFAGIAASLSGANALATTNTDDVRAVVAEMMAEAETRSSMLNAGSAGHDKKFYLASANGDFKLNVGGQIQFRYMVNSRDEDSGDELETGFQTRRTKLKFGGTVHEDWNFAVTGAFSRMSGGTFGLEDAWVGHKINDNWDVKMGQFKTQFMREENVSSSKQLTVDRSVTNEMFNQGRSQGVELAYSQDTFRAFIAFTDGFGSANSEFGSSAEGDYSFTARGEWLVDGDWTAFDDFTSSQGADYALMVGAGLNYGAISSPSGSNTSAIGDSDTEMLNYTVDVSAEGNAWNAFAAFTGRTIDTRTAGSSMDFTDFGFVVQGGHNLDENNEIFARWDTIILDEDRMLTDDTFNFITLGMNHYFASHAAKFTADVQISLDEGTTGNTGIGMLGQMDSGELAFRFQFQLLF